MDNLPDIVFAISTFLGLFGKGLLNLTVNQTINNNYHANERSSDSQKLENKKET